MSATTPVDVDPTQVRHLLDNNPRTRLIDVRTPGEFDAAHIPGSSNVPLDLLQQHRDDLVVEHEDPVVLVCASGPRAYKAHSVLTTAGMGHLRVLQGGVNEWQQHGAPLEHGSGTWAMERQVRLTAGLLVLTGVLGSTIYKPLKWLAGFVGGGLTFAALSNTCAMSRILRLLPHNRASATDAATMLTAVTQQVTGDPHSQ